MDKQLDSVFATLTIVVLTIAFALTVGACLDAGEDEQSAGLSLYEACDDQSTCKPGLSCLCGVCTRLCSEGPAACGDVADCVPGDQTGCSDSLASESGICQRTCENDTSCEDPRAQFTCASASGANVCQRTDPDAPLRDPDADTEMDAGSDASDVEGLTCENIESEFRRLVDANQACTQDSDCTLVGGTGSCNCTPVLGNGSGTAINENAAGTAVTYIDFFDSNCADSFGTCDAAPASNLRCEEGVCRADSESCLSTFDAGPESDATSSDTGADGR
jgi:hypothetical protein